MRSDAPPRVCVVIPALNEATTISSVVRAASGYGLPVVVDDGSSDDTAALAAAAGANVVRHARNHGYDGALNSGFVRASELGCQYVVTMDADGQHDPDLVRAFIAALDDGADLVVGIRDRQQRPAESVFGWVGKAAWGIADPLCGMKAYRVSLYRELGHFDSYLSIGTELAIYAATHGKRIVQIPIKTRNRVGIARFGRRLDADWRILRALLLGMAKASRR